MVPFLQVLCASLGKMALGRQRRRWKDNFKWLFKKWDGGMDWINLALDRDRWGVAVVNGVMNLRVAQNAGNFLTI